MGRRKYYGSVNDWLNSQVAESGKAWIWETEERRKFFLKWKYNNLFYVSDSRAERTGEPVLKATVETGERRVVYKKHRRLAWTRNVTS